MSVQIETRQTAAPASQASPPSQAGPPSARQDRASGVPTGHHAPLGKLVLGAIGVVFGDIGTSPLYSIKECFDPDHGVAATHANVLGILSLVVWSLTMVVTVKYLTFIMRADNRGEGGILALLALVPSKKQAGSARIGFLAGLVIFGAALLYGDGVITPAISVLSAVEGLGVATPKLTPLILPLTVAILIGLFWVQERGTATIGVVFGPIMILWFFAIAVLGVRQIVAHPSVFEALNPAYAIRFFGTHGWQGFVVLGSVVLVITGGEALYADMGHFGPFPIRVAWFGLVMPSLLLNYFGQGAWLIGHAGAAATDANPFFATVPSILIYPMVLLATAATIIASQALISGAFSLTHQAVQLGFFPRVTIVHTSGESEGQIFVPEVNTALAVACVGLVLGFKESSALAAAYGIAVTGTMAITSIVYFVVLRQTWQWPLWRAVPLVVMFLSFDLPFFGANALKFFSGGWFPVAAAIGIFLVMTTWKKGRALLGRNIAGRLLPIDVFIADVETHKAHRVPGTAVFMASNPHGVPIVLLHHWKHNQVLHQAVVFLSIASEAVPEVRSRDRLTTASLGHGFYQITARYGFMQTPNVPQIMEAAKALGVPYEPGRTSYFLGRETLLTTGDSKMFGWRKALFSFISRNARSATQYFGIPPDRVVEIGMQIDL